MKKHFLMLLFAGCFLSCDRDWYQDFPETVSGYAILSIDTGSSLLSTFFYDSLDRRDSFPNCFKEPSLNVFGYDTVDIVNYRGVQCVKGKMAIFMQVVGANDFVKVNDSTMDVSTTIGKARIVFNHQNLPRMSAYTLDPKLVFPDRKPCFAPYVDGRSRRKFDVIGYLECPVEDGKLKYGWTRKMLYKPKCTF